MAVEIACLLVVAYLSTTAFSLAAQRQPIEFRGNLDSFAQLVVARWARPQGSRFVLALGSGQDVRGPIFVNLANSRIGAAIYRDNCVATPFDNVIDCDLKLVDDLIDDFKLMEIFGSGGKRRDVYRKYIFLWILTHELGHVALKHGMSDFGEGTSGLHVFDVKQQKKELEADAAAIGFVGNLEQAPIPAYQTILDVTNALLRKSICPDTFPKLCPRIPLGGVGLNYDYTTDGPIRIPLSGTHPAFVARFLRILYLSGVGTSANSINYLAKQAIDRLSVETDRDEWTTLKSALQH
ncbi:hypothetical protein IVB41_15975 [Bradyrhizobium sp. 44]|uniref:hypothetical protein n=1 Tax=Bradyrhizobium sp. 44 TaxID=2782675 RepID=UPI001FF7B7E9|nr:hypothetical protein [Bradyrhizobium sp. 44]MCK1285419.1 hypothetical protein [Bradyrhizobium sp. 44]